MIDPVEVRLPVLWAAVKEAEAAHTDATRRLGEARFALVVGQRDDWIARARAAYPLPEGAVEGWRTRVGTQWQIPDPLYSLCTGRLIYSAHVVGQTITITTYWQDRVGEEVGRVMGGGNNVYQMRHREGKEWARRFGVTA